MKNIEKAIVKTIDEESTSGSTTESDIHIGIQSLIERNVGIKSMLISYSRTFAGEQRALENLQKIYVFLDKKPVEFKNNFLDTDTHGHLFIRKTIFDFTIENLIDAGENIDRQIIKEIFRTNSAIENINKFNIESKIIRWRQAIAEKYNSSDYIKIFDLIIMGISKSEIIRNTGIQSTDIICQEIEYYLIKNIIG